jgi:hypothetical protein
MYIDATVDNPTPSDYLMLFESDLARDDSTLLCIIDALGLEASAGRFARLEIVEIPDDVPADGWLIQDYDGIEWVAEKHRVWPDADPVPSPKHAHFVIQ